MPDISKIYVSECPTMPQLLLFTTVFDDVYDGELLHFEYSAVGMESATIVGVKKYNSVVRESDLSFPNGEMVKRLDKEVGKVSL